FVPRAVPCILGPADGGSRDGRRSVSPSGHVVIPTKNHRNSRFMEPATELFLLEERGIARVDQALEGGSDETDAARDSRVQPAPTQAERERTRALRSVFHTLSLQTHRSHGERHDPELREFRKLLYRYPDLDSHVDIPLGRGLDRAPAHQVATERTLGPE